VGRVVGRFLLRIRDIVEVPKTVRLLECAIL